MGTVGLSFGSPTSGTGFDVAATVTQIVSNLQNVETPWKNQLTALTSQDTALSSIGTLLSTVSTDLGNLTEFTGVMAQKTGSSSDNSVVQITSASTASTAGTHTIAVTSLAATASGNLNAIGASDQLSGSISITVGPAGTLHKISVNAANNTLAGLQFAINSAGIGVTASVLTDANGSRLSIVSGTSGANGNLTVTSAITDTTNPKSTLTYNPVITGIDAVLNVDGVDLKSASNTVTNLISGITFQLLASSSKSSGTQEQVQLIIGNDNTGVETAVNTFVTDYNALVAAINTQHGKDSSGNPESLFGSPTLSLLQQQLMTVANAPNPSGYIDPITTGSTLTGSMTLAVGGGVTNTIVIGAGTNTANIFYTGDGVNTLQGVTDTINAANQGTILGITASADSISGTLPAVAKGNALSGTISFAVGTGTAQTIVIGYVPATGAAANATYTGTDGLTLAQLSTMINGTASFGVTGSVTTDAKGLQTLALASTDGTSTLSANSSILAAGPGVTANLVTSNGQSTLTLQSQTAGSVGALDTESSLVATSGSTSTSLNYNNSSDLSTLANLGITVATKADGSLTFDQSTLDAALNSDFSGALGFFQNANSWGQTVTSILNNMGSSSSSGILSLAKKSNTNIEKTLNDDVTRQDASIATQKAKLTKQLNLANEILQQIPSQLDGVNMLYSAISGYNQKSS